MLNMRTFHSGIKAKGISGCNYQEVAILSTMITFIKLDAYFQSLNPKCFCSNRLKLPSYKVLQNRDSQTSS